MGSALHCRSGPSVLVVEDEPLIAFDLEDMLARMGCVVIGPAPTVNRALELLAHKEPDFAILDVNLRRERATPVAEALRVRRIPFAVATACGRAQLPETPWREAPSPRKTRRSRAAAEHACHSN